MLKELKCNDVSKIKQKITFGGAADLGVGMVTTFAVIAIIVIVLYKLYGAKTGDITLPGGFKFKFTS